MAQYRAKTGIVKLMLVKELCDQGWPVQASITCASECVDAGHVTEFWREKMGNDAADALNEDLERMKENDRR